MDNSGFYRDSAYALYVSQEHECSYLPGQQARTLFLDPSAKVTNELYQLLINRGFRRSGQFLYQPACSQCEACISLRIPVHDFKPTRSQRRNWRANHDRIQILPHPASFSEEHFELYNKYQSQRHTDGSMACSEQDQYMKFLTCDWAETRFYEFRLDQELLAVAVTDLLPTGLSSVYTFFDPDRGLEGLGVFALLWQIHHARETQRQWVYPGFWVEGCQKMNYKSNYRPFEAWNGKSWRRFGGKDKLRL
jgi:arginine-tRNA-protein transferase